jgi:transposase InsO family protein
MSRLLSKAALARILGIARSTFYYRSIRDQKDWSLKTQIEHILHAHPSYGHRRIALGLAVNKKRILRVMKLYGLQPYRRRRKRWAKPKGDVAPFPNLLLNVPFPSCPHEIWVSDFTQLAFHGRPIYMATVMDLCTRTIVGLRVMTGHATPLVRDALLDALNQTKASPRMLHSDQGSEYLSEAYTSFATSYGITLSMSRVGCPWENGYQESFYSQFKLDLGYPNRFATLGELVAEIYRMVGVYNSARIHTAFSMPPAQYAAQLLQRSTQAIQTVE